MDEKLATVYLSVLLGLLLIAAVVVLRQIIKTRLTENKFSKLQKKLQNEKGTAEEYYELASIFLDKKLFVQAGSLLKKGLKMKKVEPENQALMLNALGYSYFAQEQYDLAIKQYKEALKLYPEYVVALNNLGNVYERKKLISQALESYEKALEYEPKNDTAKRRSESLRKRFVTS